MIPVWLTWFAVQRLLGTIWSGFCAFVATPIGAALLAAVIAYNVGVHVERGRLNAQWQAKWDTAEAQAEADRLQRDANMKAQVEADADKRIDDLTTAKGILEQKLKDTENAEAARPATGNDHSCYTNRTDDEWLRDARKAIAQPEARRGLAQRLRTGGR